MSPIATHTSPQNSPQRANRTTLELVYLALAVAGALVPFAAFLPWLAEHGFDVPLFVQELFANRISAFFGWDVIISAIVVIVAVIAGRGGFSARQRLAVIAGTLLVGVSLGLPLLLLFHERANRLSAQHLTPESPAPGRRPGSALPPR